MANTTRTQIPNEVNNFYSRALLERAVPALVYTRFGQVRDIPMNSGSDVIKFRRYGSLTAATTPLSEGVTPSGSQLSVTDITATLDYYGDYVTLTDKLQYETIDPILTETAEVLGEQAGDTLDQVARDVLVAGTNVQYSGSATSRATVADVIDLTAIKKAVRTLKNGNAKPVTSMIDPSTGYNTQGIRAAFIGIVHPNTTYDLESVSGWVPVEKYADPSKALPNEVGSVAGVRFLETTNAKVFSGAGSGGADVYATLILGKNAYGVTRLSGKSLENIVKPLGSAGSADPLNQRATSGWKASFVAKILNDNFMVRVEHTVSA